MHYQSKLLVSHLSLILLLIFMFVSIFHYYYTNESEKNLKRNLEASCEKMLQQFDELVRPMEFVTDYILSDIEVIKAINLLTQSDRSRSSSAAHIQREKSVLRIALRTYASVKYFYRLNYINPIGDFITSNYLVPSVIDYNTDLSKPDWIEEARRANGHVVITPPAPDPWSIAEKPEVFSLVRMIRGNENMGFIEVQQSLDKLRGVFSIPGGSGINVIAVCGDNRFFYSDTADPDKDLYYISHISREDPSIQQLKNPFAPGDVYAAQASSQVTGLRLMLIQSEEIFTSQTRFVVLLSIGIGLLLFTLSMLYVFLMSRYLTGPIRKLKQLMESTGLDNLKGDIAIAPTNDEFAVLNQSYRRLLKRLDTAIVRQNKLSSLQAQASFDSLQAQVNPHFLYNVLNVISNRGVVNDDEKICDMCASLAAMFRYSTSNTRRLSTVGEELEHLRHYLYLINTRYEDKLQFSIDFDERLYGQPFPKIVLQQLAENSINHGYDAPVETMLLQFDGWLEEGWMYIRIRDNGCGFKDAGLLELRKRMLRSAEELDQMERNLQMEIGGLGLVNIYARFYLLYKDRFVMRIENYDAGAQVIIGKIME
jgi:two-component system sensor histidine kinase YesM